jgi:hypothetical protein
VKVNLAVVQGNPVDVFLARADQLETIKKEQWNNVQVCGFDFGWGPPARVC